MQQTELFQALTPLVDRAVALAKGNQVLKADRDQVREIGRQALEIGGMHAMLQVYDRVRYAWSAGAIGLPQDELHFHPSELEAAWDGIGEWRW